MASTASAAGRFSGAVLVGAAEELGRGETEAASGALAGTGEDTGLIDDAAATGCACCPSGPWFSKLLAIASGIGGAFGRWSPSGWKPFSSAIYL